MMSVIAIFIWALLPFSTEVKCTEHRTGTFSLKDESLGSDHLIVRTDSIQTETDLKTGAKSKYKVTWVTDCEYELNIIEGGPEIMDFYRDKTLIIQIMDTTKDGYRFQGFIKGTDRVVTQVLKRVK